MRSITLLESLILGSIITTSSCVSDPVNDGSSVAATEDVSIAADESSFDVAHGGGAAVDARYSTVIDEEPHEISEDQLDSNQQASIEKLDCGLSIMTFSDYTNYWIRNCFEHAIHAQILMLDNDASDNDALYLGEDQWVQSLATVSGSVRGRVLRLRRR